MSDGPLPDQRTETQHGPLLLQADFDAEQVADLRRGLTDCLSAAGLAGERLDDFVTAVNEAMTNAVRHGGGTGELRLWRQRHLVCEIRDRGEGFADPLPTIPTNRPRPSANGGMGLWLARELADSIEVRSGTDGVLVRLTMAVADPAALPAVADAVALPAVADAVALPAVADEVAGSGGAGHPRIDRAG